MRQVPHLHQQVQHHRHLGFLGPAFPGCQKLHSLKTIMHEVASDPDQVVALDAALEVVLLQFQSLKVHDVGLGGAAPRTRKCQRAQQPGAADKGSGSGSSSSAAELGSGSRGRGAA